MQTTAFVNDVAGRVTLIRGDGLVQQIRARDLLRQGDFVLVSDGHVGIVFADGSRLTIIESGQLLLKQVAYDAASSEGGITVSAAAGHFEFVPGALAEQSPAVILLETPAAKIHPGKAALAFEHSSADGLSAGLIDASQSDQGLVVDNELGSAALSDPHKRITVSGPEDPPVLERSVASAGPQSVEIEVSAGGDEAAFPGDPIVVTGGLKVFDLSPEPAPLPGPSSGTLLPASSPFVAPQHDYLLFGGQAAASSSIDDETLTGSGSSSSAGSKYRTLTGWEPLGLVWELVGSGQVTGEAPTFPYGRDSRQIQPTEKHSMAGLALASEQVPTVTLTEFFGDGSPARFPQSSVEVSAIRAPLALSAGDELSFDFFFDAGDTVPKTNFEPVPRNDSAMAMVRNTSLPISGDSFYSLSSIAAIADESSTRDIGASGWRTVVYDVPTSGVYTIGFTAVDDRIAAGPSALYIDNVRINRQLGPDWVVVAEDGRWRTLVQGAVARDDDLLDVGEDAIVPIPAAYLLANDTDPDPFDKMSITGIDRAGTVGRATAGSGGIVTYQTVGRFDYLAEGERGTDSFRYELDPGNGVTTTAAVRVTIIGANNAPVAKEDDTVIAADRTELINVLRDDDDIDSDDDPGTLRVVEAHAALGHVSFSGQPGDGIAYAPAGHYVYLGVGQTALDTITYVIQDRHGARATATFDVTVTGVNDTPTARDDTASTNEDTATVVAVLANDTDPDRNDELFVSAIDGRPITGAAGVRLPSGAIVSLDAQGRLGYDPRGSFDRLALGETASDSFRYQIADGHGGFADAGVTVRIDGRNDAPIALADLAVVGEDGPPIDVDVLANDDDIDSDDDPSSLRVVSAQSAAGAEVQFGGLTGAGLSYAPAGRFEYLAVGETAIDTITYTVEDRHGARAIGTAAVTIIGANDAPTANDDRTSIDEDSVLALPLLANDTDPDRSDRLQVTAINGEPIVPGGRVTLASGASVTMDAAGALAYDPRGQFDSLARGDTATDSLRYRIEDGHGGGSEAEATIIIVGRNDPPTAVADAATVAEDDFAIFIDVLANDDDVDTDDGHRDLRVLAAEAASGAPVTFSRGFGAGITYHPDGRFETLDEGETGTDTITYTVADGRGGESTGTVKVTIIGANDAPRAVADLLMIDANTVLQLPKLRGVLANDYDPDRPEDHDKDWMQVVSVDGQSAHVGATITLASGALLTVNADGGLSYDPNGKFDGLTDFERATDGFTYTIIDEHGATATTTATISIQGKNDPPMANADRAVTDQDSAVRIPVLFNEDDPDAGGNLRVLSVDTAQTRGSVRINADGTLTYDPAGRFGELGPGEAATDTFTYVVDDFVGGRGTGVVTVTVNGAVRPQASAQELVQSFEVGPLPNPSWVFLGTIGTSARFDVPGQAGQVAFQPTHDASMLLLQASGSNGLEIERYLSDRVTVGGRPLVHLPNDPIDGSSPNAGAASKSVLSLAPGDLVGGRMTLSFDWNFISGEAQPAVTSLNDFAVFTVTDGNTAQVYKLADARQTSGFPEGWRTSIYDVTANFALPARGDLKLTIGFAVLNDQSPENPSRLLVDNVRLNRLPDDHQELLRTDGSFASYREHPEAADDAIFAVGGVPIGEDTIAVFGGDLLLANDRASTGVGAASMRILDLNTDGTIAAASLSGGGIAYDPRGRFDFLAEGQTGTDRFRYIIGDGNGGTDGAEVSITVIGRNDAPSANTDEFTIDEGVPLGLNVLANDEDVDSDDDRGTLRIVAASAAATGAVVTFAGVAGAGLVYRPSNGGNFAGLGEGETAIDTITYTIEDRYGARATGSSMVTVVGRNDAPTAGPDQGTTDEDTAISMGVLTNDSDPDIHDRLFIGAINGIAITPGAHVSLTSGAIASVGADGTLHYDPTTGFSHLALGQTATDTFSYTAFDGHGGASTANVSVSINGRNDVPIVVRDALSTAASTRLTVAASSLLANDIDPDTGDGMALVGIDSSSTLGTVSFDGTIVSYDPGPQFRGLGEGETATDIFTYRVADRYGETDTGQVTVNVRGVNDAPIAADDGVLTDEDTPLTLNVRANDTDPDVHDGIPTVTSINTSGTRGQVVLHTDGSITYDPRGRFDSLNNGQVDHDSFTYRITDAHGAADEGTVTIAIAGRSDTERLIDSFESPFSAANRTSSIVTTVTEYQENDGARKLYQQTDGVSMARLEAFGTSAQKIGSQTVSPLEAFLGMPDRSLPKDPGDNTFPANGSAFKVRVSAQAGDEISFDWMFDARDTVSTSPADNDYGVFTVVGGAGPELFKLSDVRQTGDQGASGWRSSIYTATTTGDLTLGFGAVNDRIADPLGQGSVLLVDNLRFNRDFDHGYQIVDQQANGRFETVIATP